MRILALDIGNTFVHIGIFEGEQLTISRIIKTPEDPLHEALVIGSIRALREVSDAIISSVVPWLTPIVLEEVTKISERKPILLTSDTDLGIEIHYKKGQLGSDRIANCLYIRKFVHQNSIVVDAGTAITVDAIGASGEFLGGIILPGPHTALEGLSEKAALLKNIDLEAENTFLGKSTAQCLRIGLVSGLGMAVRELVKSMKKELGWESPRLFLTGGDSQLLREFLRDFEYVRDLSLLGLKAALEELRSREQ